MKLQLAIAVGLALATNVAIGQEVALKSLDTDSDGKVTVKEFSEYASERLPDFDQMDAFAKKVDADGNGVISEDEFSGRREALQSMSEMQQDGKEKMAKEKAAHKVGDMASDFELQGIGKTIKLSDNFGDKGNPVVVVFSRANW